MDTTLTSPPDLQKILTKLSADQSLSPDDFNHDSQLLKEYECWVPFAKFLEKQITSKSPVSFFAYKEMIGLYLYYDYNESKSHRLIRDMLVEFKPTFKDFLNDTLSPLKLSLKSIVPILTHAAPYFTSKEQINCFEYIAINIEKILHDDSMAKTINKKLLQLDGKNLHALKYFKNLHQLNQEWEQVVDYLKRIIAASSVELEISRNTQELAGIYLYQFNDPMSCLELLKSRSTNEQHLDQTMLLYDAYYVTQQWLPCLNILQSFETEFKAHKNPDIKKLTILSYRMGCVAIKLDDLPLAKKALYKAISATPDFWEAYEELVQILIKEKNWSALGDLLKQIQTHSKDQWVQEWLPKLQGQVEVKIQASKPS